MSKAQTKGKVISFADDTARNKLKELTERDFALINSRVAVNYLITTSSGFTVIRNLYR